MCLLLNSFIKNLKTLLLFKYKKPQLLSYGSLILFSYSYSPQVANLRYPCYNRSGVNCYFTIVDSNEKILLTVYRDRSTKEYTLKETDFRDCPINTMYEVETKLNAKGNIKFVNVIIL